MQRNSNTAPAPAKAPPWAKIVASAARDARLSEMHFRTLVAVASYAAWRGEGGPGEAWPKLATLERDHGIAKGTGSRCTRDLAAWGYWRIEPRAKSRGGRAAHRYLVARDVELPATFDRAKLRQLGTSTAPELASSTTKEGGSSVQAERQSSKGRKTEQTTPANQAEPSTAIRSDSRARVAGSARAEPAGADDGAIRIRRGLSIPPSFVPMARGFGLDRERCDVEWRAFATAQAGKILPLQAMRAAFKAQLAAAHQLGFSTLRQTAPMPAVFAAAGRDAGLAEDVVAASWLVYAADRAGQTRHAEAWLKDMRVWLAREAGRPATRYAGERLAANAPLSADDRAAAIEIGLSARWIDHYWYEFRCEANSAPGARGFSTNWSNRWRQFCARKLETKASLAHAFEVRGGRAAAT